MKRYLLILSICLLLAGCKDDFNDLSKRNGHWAWWIDAKNGKGKWIRVGDSTTVKNGRYTLFYASGSIYEKGHIVNRKYVDTIFRYDVLGVLQIYKFPKGDTCSFYFLKNGSIKICSQSGELEAEGIIENHLCGDLWTAYYPNGHVKYKKKYKNGIGWLTDYYENGNVSDSTYNDGHQLVNIKHWGENGLLMQAFEIHQDVANGIDRTYYENGQLKQMLTIVNGRATGRGMAWYEDGKFKALRSLKSDQYDGHQIEYFESGKVLNDYYFKDGKLNGPVKKYREDGSIIIDGIFKDGVQISGKSANPMTSY